MQIEAYCRCCSAFRSAFGLEGPWPTWRETRNLDEETLLRAIATVQASPKTRFYNSALIAGLVMDATRPERKKRKRKAQRGVR
jgi:hypothetical protein